MASSSRPAVADNLRLPVGFRFLPTEEELVSYYLQMKLQGRDDLVGNIIGEIEICKHEPWDLPAFSLMQSDDDEWYFFNRPQYKHKLHNNKNSKKQTVRATPRGYWKITGKERVIKARDNRTVIGKKRILTFYKGLVRNAQKTNWVIHEYYIPDEIHPNAKKRDFVLCRLKKKSDDNAIDATTCDEGETSTHDASDFENQPAHNMEIFEMVQGDSDYFERERDRLLNVHSNNDNNGMRYGFGSANTPDDGIVGLEWADKFFVDQDQDSYEEIAHTTVFNDSTLPQASRTVYADDSEVSSDTDTEVAHKQIMSTHMYKLQADLSHSRRDKAVMLHNQFSRQSASSVNVVPKSQTDRLQLVTREHPSTYERTRKPQPQPASPIVLRNASSVDNDANVLQINYLQLVTDDYYRNARTRRQTYPPSGVTALGNSRELEQQQSKDKEASERRSAVDLPQKKPSITKSNNVTKVTQGNAAEKGMKETQKTTKASNWKGSSFISWETSPSTSPPSAYILNTVIGTILFLIFAWEVVFYG